jgi:hypothetical protein
MCVSLCGLSTIRSPGFVRSLPDARLQPRHAVLTQDHARQAVDSGEHSLASSARPPNIRYARPTRRALSFEATQRIQSSLGHSDGTVADCDLSARLIKSQR